jgi:hypothetical protein
MYYNCVKFHKNSISSLVGVALTRYMDGWTDGRTDYHTPYQPEMLGLLTLWLIWAYCDDMGCDIQMAIYW